MIKDNQTDWHWSKYEGDHRYNNYWSHFHLSTNLQHVKRKKYLSPSIYCISITSLPSNNSFKVHVRKKILWKYLLLITLSAIKTFPTCKEKKYIFSPNIYCTSITRLTSYNSFKVRHRHQQKILCCDYWSHFHLSTTKTFPAYKGEKNI